VSWVALWWALKVHAHQACWLCDGVLGQLVVVGGLKIVCLIEEERRNIDGSSCIFAFRDNGRGGDRAKVMRRVPLMTLAYIYQ
jgi:hypothetical protein